MNDLSVGVLRAFDIAAVELGHVRIWVWEPRAPNWCIPGQRAQSVCCWADSFKNRFHGGESGWGDQFARPGITMRLRAHPTRCKGRAGQGDRYQLLPRVIHRSGPARMSSGPAPQGGKIRYRKRGLAPYSEVAATSAVTSGKNTYPRRSWCHLTNISPIAKTGSGTHEFFTYPRPSAGQI